MSKITKQQDERTIEIYFENGFRVLAEYKIDEDTDDYIWEDFKKAWDNNMLWFPSEWADFELKIGENNVDEIDMRKVIGAKYN